MDVGVGKVVISTKEVEAATAGADKAAAGKKEHQDSEIHSTGRNGEDTAQGRAREAAEEEGTS